MSQKISKKVLQSYKSILPKNYKSIYNFYNFKYLINKRQQSAVIICAIRTARIKLINLFLIHPLL